MLSFSAALKVNWYRRFSANGRAARSEFWWMFVTNCLINIVLTTVMRLGSVFALLCLVVSVALLAFMACTAARRLHDRNLSAWWLLLVFIPTFGWIILLVLCALPGTQGPNRFGPDPRMGNFYHNILASGNNYRSQERYEWYQWQEEQKPGDPSNRYDQGHNDGAHFNPFEGHDEFGEQLKAQRRPNDDNSAGDNSSGGSTGGGFAP